MGYRKRAIRAQQAAALIATQMQLAQTQAQLAQVQNQNQHSYNKGFPPPYQPGFIGYPQQSPAVQSVAVINNGYGICTLCRRKRRTPIGSLVRMAISAIPFHHRHHYCHCC